MPSFCEDRPAADQLARLTGTNVLKIVSNKPIKAQINSLGTDAEVRRGGDSRPRRDLGCLLGLVFTGDGGFSSY